jgi:hypothetical protein
MGWVLFVAGAVLSWGVYGVMLHQGGVQLGNPLKALLCVGVAYFLIGVLIPVGALSAQGGLSNFNSAGLVTATIAGALGAIGAACIIYAFKFGGLPLYVMPLVFGGAPIVNVLFSMLLHPGEPGEPDAWLSGSVSCLVDQAMVAHFRPRPGDLRVPWSWLRPPRRARRCLATGLQWRGTGGLVLAEKNPPIGWSPATWTSPRSTSRGPGSRARPPSPIVAGN